MILLRFIARVILALLACAAGLCCFLGTVVGLVPGATICPEQGEELLAFQMQGIAVAVVSFVILVVLMGIIEWMES